MEKKVRRFDTAQDGTAEMNALAVLEPATWDCSPAVIIGAH